MHAILLELTDDGMADLEAVANELLSSNHQPRCRLGFELQRAILKAVISSIRSRETTEVV